MRNTTTFLPTGLTPLDPFLGGGWPVGGVTELTGKRGGGKTLLALRSAANLTHQRRWVALVSLGDILFPPAIAAAGLDLPFFLWLRPKENERCRWAVEQVVRSTLFPLVLVSDVFYDERDARRLQLTSEKTGTTILFLTSQKSHVNLWALALRLQVERKSLQTVAIHLLRSRKLLSQTYAEVSLYENPTNPRPLLSEPSLSRIAS